MMIDRLCNSIFPNKLDKKPTVPHNTTNVTQTFKRDTELTLIFTNKINIPKLKTDILYCLQHPKICNKISITIVSQCLSKTMAHRIQTRLS